MLACERKQNERQMGRIRNCRVVAFLGSWKSSECLVQLEWSHERAQTLQGVNHVL